MIQRAAIFDMDNVLFPTEELKFRAYAQVLAERYGIRVEDTPERVGLSERAAMTFFLERYGLESQTDQVAGLIQAKRAAYYGILERTAFAPYDGARSLLAELRCHGWKTGLATMSDGRSTETLLGRFDFRRLFDAVISVENVSRPKPDPEIYLAAAERLGVPAADCVAVEDSPTGLEAARRAGMKTIAVTNSVPYERLAGADLVVESLSQLRPAAWNESAMILRKTLRAPGSPL
jgi:HAD superfamily hydrolase (TIGR01509 family)